MTCKVKYSVLTIITEHIMKRIISFLVILCVATSLFALGSIRVGGSFSLVTGRTKPFTQEDKSTIVRYTSSGFGFDILGKDDLSDSIATWFDFNMTFGTSGKIKNYNDSEWTSFDDLFKNAEAYAKSFGGTAKKKLYSLSASGGVMYKLPFTNTHFNYAIGGGLFIDRLFADITVYLPEDYNKGDRVRCFNVGLTTYSEISNKLSDHFGVSLTVMLRLGILNFSTNAKMENGKILEELRAFGFAPSFNMPVVLGVSYYF